MNLLEGTGTSASTQGGRGRRVVGGREEGVGARSFRERTRRTRPFFVRLVSEEKVGGNTIPAIRKIKWGLDSWDSRVGRGVAATWSGAVLRCRFPCVRIKPPRSSSAFVLDDEGEELAHDFGE